MRTQHWLLALSVTALSFCAAWGVSQVGGGTKVSLDSKQVSIRVPTKFEVIERAPGRISLVGDLSQNSDQEFIRPVINIDRLELEFPELKGLSQQEINKHFISNSWREAVLADPCAKAYIAENETAVSLVVSWGENRGSVMMAPNTPDSKAALTEMTRSLDFLKGACSWK